MSFFSPFFSSFFSSFSILDVFLERRFVVVVVVETYYSSRANEIFFFFLRSSRHVRNLVGVIDFSFHVQDRERDEAQDDSSMDDNTAEKK